MIGPSLLTLAALVFPLLAAATPTADTPSDDERLGRLVQQYVWADDADQAATLFAEILQHPSASVSTVEHVLARGLRYAPQPVGRQFRLPVAVRGVRRTYGLYVPTSYEPSQAYPLVICLHGAGFTGEAYLDRWEARLGEQYILACPTLMEGTWWTRTAEELILATLRAVQARYRIDPDRIFLTGMSNGGIGTYLVGTHHAWLFAGLAPMASGLDDVLFPLLENLHHTPLYVIHGRRDQVMPVELSQAMVKELSRLGIPHVYREHERTHPMAGGHYFPREELAELVTWFGQRHRGPLPSRVTLVRDASHLTPFAWVRIDATDRIAALSENLIDNHDETMLKRIYARLEAAVVAPNRIEVQTQHIRRYSLYLNEGLVDFTHPVTVITNGRLSFEGLVTPTLQTLLRDARLRRDPQRLFPALLTIPVDANPE